MNNSEVNSVVNGARKHPVQRAIQIPWNWSTEK